MKSIDIHSSVLLKLKRMEVQLKYLQKSTHWEPFRYSVFVDVMRNSIEGLKELSKTFPENSDEVSEKRISSWVKNLLNQYISVWENEYN